MKVADYIAGFLAKQGISHVFVVSGSSVVRMIDSVARHPEIDYVCAQHEQNAGTEADCYARISNNIGVAIVTSGPGATNLTTAVANAFYDSVPVIFLSGQVSSNRIKKSAGLRQRGFQETDTVNILTPITKYSARLTDPFNIRYKLEKSVYLAKENRQGPVFLDIPSDFTGWDIEPDKLPGFIPANTESVDKHLLSSKIRKMEKFILQAEKPILIFGAGIGRADSRGKAVEFAGHFGIPVARTYGGADVIPTGHKLYIGTVGVAGERGTNFAVQTADLVIAIGTRLSTSITGGNLHLFAPSAKKVIVDIDGEELKKFRTEKFIVDIPIQTDIQTFFTLSEKLNQKKPGKTFTAWVNKINRWREKYPVCPKSYYTKKKWVNPYVFIKELSSLAKKGDIIAADTGANLCWTIQAWETKVNQRIISAWNHTPMGYALPASVGAYFAQKKRQNIFCLIGDGGLLMSLSELATVARHRIPIKIFVFNNQGYGILKQRIDSNLPGRYEAVDTASGLSFPDFNLIGKAFGLKVLTLKNHKELKLNMRKIVQSKEPYLVNLKIDPAARIVPFLGKGTGLEDLDPRLPKEEIAQIIGKDYPHQPFTRPGSLKGELVQKVLGKLKYELFH